MATTIRAIAHEAGVAEPTVYFSFRSKRAIVRELIKEIVESPSLDVHQALREPDPRQRLVIGASIIRQLAERSQEVIHVLRSAADSDRQLRREWRRWQKGHLWAVQQVVKSLVASKGLRDGLSSQTATDMLYFLAGVDGYRLLVVERGWPPDRYEQWLADTGRRLLLRS